MTKVNEVIDAQIKEIENKIDILINQIERAQENNLPYLSKLTADLKLLRKEVESLRNFKKGWNIMPVGKLVTLMVVLCLLTACGIKSTTVPLDAVVTTTTLPGASTTTITAPTQTTTTTLPQNVSLTYYVLSSSVHTQLTGYCMHYNGNTYCWDNGRFTIGVTYFSYWGQRDVNGSVMMSPIKMVMDVNGFDFVTQAAYVSQSQIDQVFGIGTPMTVNCSQNGMSLICGSLFTINLNQ